MTAVHLALILAPVCAGLVVCAVGWLRAEKRAALRMAVMREDCGWPE